MWWYNNVPQSIAMIMFPLYNHFFVLYLIHFLLLSSTLQLLWHNWPSGNSEELFNPGTIFAVVSDGDNILGSGREPFLIACNVPEYIIIIIGPGALTILYNQCWSSSLMKCLDAPLSTFNMTMVLLMFNISFEYFYRVGSSVVWFI